MHLNKFLLTGAPQQDLSMAASISQGTAKTLADLSNVHNIVIQYKNQPVIPHLLF